MKSLKTSYFLFLFVLMSVMGRPLYAEITPQEPNLNTDDNFYEIETLENLYWVAEKSNEGLFANNTYKIRLMADINVNPDIDYQEVKSWTANGMNRESLNFMDRLNKWTPIATGTNSFNTEFDGNGHTIRNIFYDPTNILDKFGLFGNATMADIHDLTITNSVFIANNYCAALLASTGYSVTINRIQISYCAVDILDYSSNHYAAGVLASSSSDTSISNISMTSVLTPSETFHEGYFGGIVGFSSMGDVIKNCFFMGYGQIKPNFMIWAYNEAVAEGLPETTINSIATNNYYTKSDVTDSYYGIEPIDENSVSSGRLCWLLNEKVSGGDTWRHYIAPGLWPMLFQNDNQKVYKLNDYVFANDFNDEIDGNKIVEIGLDETLGFVLPEPIDVFRVSYRRITAGNKWHTVCLPFALKQSDYTNKAFYRIDNIAEKANNEYVINLQKVDEIPANTPAIIRKLDTYLDLDFDLTAQTGSKIQVGGDPDTITCGDFEFRGVYEAGTAFDEDETSTGRYFFVSQDALWRGINPFSIKPFRAYLYCTKEDMGAAPMRFTLNTLDEVSAIDALEDVAPHSQHVTDLMGRPASPDAKGLLITNHKKLLVR
ncbi:MAG: hypothetical protein IJS20_07605 [Bacteroidales bacterium]|nr:hypothetical protein [Bacteroidales bacterium]